MTPYSQLTTDQLRSAIVERDEQLRVALDRVASVVAGIEDMKSQRDEWERKFMESESNEVQSLKSQLHASQERCKVCEGLLVDERNNTKSLLTTHKTVLKECVDALNGCNEMFDTYGHTSESPCVRDKEIVSKMLNSLTHATALLEGSKGEV